MSGAIIVFACTIDTQRGLRPRLMPTSTGPPCLMSTFYKPHAYGISSWNFLWISKSGLGVPIFSYYISELNCLFIYLPY